MAGKRSGYNLERGPVSFADFVNPPGEGPIPDWDELGTRSVQEAIWVCVFYKMLLSTIFFYVPLLVTTPMNSIGNIPTAEFFRRERFLGKLKIDMHNFLL